MDKQEADRLADDAVTDGREMMRALRRRVAVDALQKSPRPWHYDDYTGDWTDAKGHYIDFGDAETVKFMLWVINGPPAPSPTIEE